MCNTFKLLSKKWFQTLFSNCYLYKLLYKLSSESSLEAILTNYFQRNHFQRFFLHTNYISEKLLQHKIYQQLLENHFKQYLHTFIWEPIANYAYNSLSEESFQTVLTYFYLRANCKLCFQEFIREFNSFQTMLPIYSTFITKNDFETNIRKLITNNTFRSSLNSAISKTKG